MDKCPYCLQVVTRPLSQILESLTPRENYIYETVLNAGGEGIAAEELAEECLPGRKDITLRTALHNINVKIAPLKIRTGGRRCWLDRTNWPQDRLQETFNEVHGGTSS